MELRKIAIFTHGVRAGAFAAIAVNLSRGFERAGVRSEIVVLSATPEECEKYPDVSITQLGAKRAALSVLRLARYLKENQPDVLISMPWYFNVIAVAAKRISGVKSINILTEQNVVSIDAKCEHRKSLKMQAVLPLMRLAYPWAQGLVTVSQDVLDDLRQEVRINTDSLRCKVIDNPVDTVRIRELAGLVPEESYFQGTGYFQVITVARLAKQKSLDVLLHAIKQVQSVLPVRLLILGEGPERAALTRLVTELGLEDSVSMPGFSPNPYAHMASSDVFVLSSLWEGFGLVVVEAMSVGVPVIVTDCPGGPKDIVRDGETGRIVAAGDPNALAIALLEMLQDQRLRDRFAAEGEKRAADFAVDAIAGRYLAFAGEAMNGQR